MHRPPGDNTRGATAAPGVSRNVAVGRNGAGVHWRTDALGGMELGEAVAIGIMQEHKLTYNDKVEMSLTKFDGTKITI